MIKDNIATGRKRFSVEQAKKAMNCAVAPICVPFHKNGDIDYKSLDSLVEFIIENGSRTLLLT